MDLSALRTLESAKYGGDMGCWKEHANSWGRWDAANQPLAPMGTCIGANGLDSAAGTGVPAFAPAL